MTLAMAARRRTQPDQAHQHTWCDVSMPLRSYQAASNVVGEFFEALTAKMVHGHRRAVFGRAGDNPDVVNGAGRVYESKAAGRGRWLLEERQLQQLEATPHARYVLWAYRGLPGEGGLVRLGTAGALRSWLGCNITSCTVMPATFPRKILAGTPHAEPRRATGAGRIWGSNYWFRERYLREWLAGERAIPGLRVQRRTWSFDLNRSPILGTIVASFELLRLFEISAPRQKTASTCVRCGARRQPACDVATAEQRRIATVARDELQGQRHRIAIVPIADGRRIRVVEQRTPEWYREIYWRRNRNAPRHFGHKRKPGQKAHQSIRGYVMRALARIAGGCVSNHHCAMDREILEALEERP
ncbi:MAG: hypothetical protein Q8Q14_10015 [Gemmatimonadales bacterium]|nr:hypothetical protein [Gemmatimonadales bacterium]